MNHIFDQEADKLNYRDGHQEANIDKERQAYSLSDTVTG
jgi:hypothetical protein